VIDRDVDPAGLPAGGDLIRVTDAYRAFTR
jgi:hypothetical protein